MFRTTFLWYTNRPRQTTRCVDRCKQGSCFRYDSINPRNAVCLFANVLKECANEFFRHRSDHFMYPYISVVQSSMCGETHLIRPGNPSGILPKGECLSLYLREELSSAPPPSPPEPKAHSHDFARPQKGIISNVYLRRWRIEFSGGWHVPLIESIWTVHANSVEVYMLFGVVDPISKYEFACSWRVMKGKGGPHCHFRRLKFNGLLHVV